MRTHRLRKHADYQSVYKLGRKQFAKQIGYFYALRPERSLGGVQIANPTHGPRVGLTVPKALGNAVQRNRIKRRMREAVQHSLPLLSSNVDVILHPRRSVIDLAFSALEQEIAQIFRSVQAACERTVGGHVRP